jgi:hypothetical protein
LWHTLLWSQEDFARLMGATQSSAAARESPDRTAPPWRPAELLMQLVAQAVQTKELLVLEVLLDEAKTWNVVQELRVPHP